MTALARLIRERIATHGPLSVADYMQLCLGHPEHGYYMNRDPFGAGGDFTTAPEISQMFGEMLGAWLAQVWQDQGSPDPFVLAEAGPGRGTLMRDMMRVLRRVPGCAGAARVWLIETSPLLQNVQRATLDDHNVQWCGSVEELPAWPLFYVANEFFDALPVRQFQRVGDMWCERLVGVAGDSFAFVRARPRPDAVLDQGFGPVPDGTIVEVNAAAEAICAALAGRITAHGGVALLVDYGAWDGTGDTLQAMWNHAPVDPLTRPGEADLTAHVRFRALAEAGQGGRFHGPVDQGVFLDRLGIGHRAAALMRGQTEEVRAQVAAANHRLTDVTEMGNLFKVAALTQLQAPALPGLDE